MDRRVAVCVAGHTAFANKKFLTPGLERVRGGGVFLAAFVLRPPTFLAVLLNRVAPLFDITGQLLRLSFCLVEGQAGTAAVDTCSPCLLSLYMLGVPVLADETAGAFIGHHQAARRHSGVPVGHTTFGRHLRVSNESRRQLLMGHDRVVLGSPPGHHLLLKREETSRNERKRKAAYQQQLTSLTEIGGNSRKLDKALIT